MKTVLLLIIVIGTKFCVSQNLVPNHSFEDYWNCPIGSAQFNYLNNWSNPTSASPDYFNSCTIYYSVNVPDNFTGYQDAHSGNAYAGFGVYNTYILPDTNYDYREYVQVQLIETLEFNKKYNIIFFISLADSVNYSLNNFGILFTDTSFYINSNSVLQFIPQIDYMYEDSSFFSEKEKWMEINTNYTANGGEKFLTIGNFRTNNNTDTIFVGNGAGAGSGFNGVYYYIDDVSVILDTTVGANEVLRVKSEEYKIYPNPSSTSLFIDLFNFNADIVAFELYDIIGKQIIKNTLLELNNKLNITEIPQGVYYYKLLINKEIFSGKIVVIH